jgi:glutamate dehydrogenase/leucine dehydrogenase/CBS domain-containing protein
MTTGSLAWPPVNQAIEENPAMIPNYMDQFLHQVLPEQTWRNRLLVDGPRRYVEFGPQDLDRLRRMGIEADRLGPFLVACMWDEDSPLEIGGYLVVDNLAMGRPSMGGIRMLPAVTPAAIHNLARGMTLKNAAADLPYGGGKCGIVCPDHDLTPAEHTAIIRGFAHLIHRYHDIYLPGPDVGTNDQDMRTIALENGLNNALSKTVDMGGNRIDQLGAAAQGVVVAIDTLLDELPRLSALPQFAGLTVPPRHEVTVLIQGFGAVGTHTARILLGDDPDQAPTITGISDASGYLYDPDGLPTADLLDLQRQRGVVARPYFEAQLSRQRNCTTKFSNNCDDLLREDAFCLVPAAPVANYLAVDAASKPSMTVDRMGNWAMIVEGANTYSPDPARRAARTRMERTVYWQRGTLIATDFLVNSGGVIYAAQEHLIKAPVHLIIPDEMLGDAAAVDRWLADHAADFADLAEQRRQAGDAWVKRVISRNMRELVDLLLADPDLLPCEAAERIGINRIARKESGRTVLDVMEPIPTIGAGQTVTEAAQLLTATPGDILAVVSPAGDLVGVVTDWNITHAVATGCSDQAPLTQIMTSPAITACPADSILEVLRKLELHEISAMPVVTDEGVTGVISSDILAQRTLYRLLQAQS